MIQEEECDLSNGKDGCTLQNPLGYVTGYESHARQSVSDERAVESTVTENRATTKRRMKA